MNTKNDHYVLVTDELMQKLAGGPLSMAMILSSHRKADYKTLAQYAKMLGISKAHLCDIEKGRRLVSPKRAARFAKKMGHSTVHLIQVAVNDLLRKEGLKYQAELKEVS